MQSVFTRFPNSLLTMEEKDLNAVASQACMSMYVYLDCIIVITVRFANVLPLSFFICSHDTQHAHELENIL